MFKSTGTIEQDDFFDFLRFDDPSAGHQWAEDDSSNTISGTEPLSHPYVQTGDVKKTDTLSR